MAIFTKLHRRSGVGWYYIRFEKADGRRKVEKAGTTRAQAEKRLKKRLGEVATGTYVDPREVPHGSQGPTFGEFADRFMADYGRLRRSEYYEIALRPVRAYFEGRALREITPSDLDRYRVHCVLEGLSPSTVRKRLILLGTMFKLARRWGTVAVNPAADLEKPSESRHKTRYLSREEWDRLHAHAEPWLRPVLTLAVLTGMRLKEVAGLRWENVDLKNGLLYVSEDCKTARSRAIPFGDTARDLLTKQEQIRREVGRVTERILGFVFVDEAGEPYTLRRERNRITQRTKAASKGAGLPGVTFHTLRHTAGSWMAQAGKSAVEIAKVLGHATTATTDRYMHLSPEHLRSAVAAIEAVLNAPATQTATCSNPEVPTESTAHGSAIIPRTSNHTGR